MTISIISMVSFQFQFDYVIQFVCAIQFLQLKTTELVFAWSYLSLLFVIGYEICGSVNFAVLHIVFGCLGAWLVQMAKQHSIYFKTEFL